MQLKYTTLRRSDGDRSRHTGRDGNRPINCRYHQCGGDASSAACLGNAGAGHSYTNASGCQRIPHRAGYRCAAQPDADCHSVPHRH